jgi:hypothetical protein
VGDLELGMASDSVRTDTALAPQTLNVGANFLTVTFDHVMCRAARRDGRGPLCECVDLFRHHQEVFSRRARPRAICDRRAQMTDWDSMASMVASVASVTRDRNIMTL